MYNDMINASLGSKDASIICVARQVFPMVENGQPSFYFPSFANGIIDLTGFDDITHEALRNYHFLWLTYYYERSNFTLVCLNSDFNCTSEVDNGRQEKFQLVHQNDYYADEIRNNPDYGEIIEGSSSSPPCLNTVSYTHLTLQTILLV